MGMNCPGGIGVGSKDGGVDPSSVGVETGVKSVGLGAGIGVEGT
jgi:hypothetical protein